MINSNNKATFLKSENAQTFVEFALVFPIVLLITFGLIEFGRMLFIYAVVQSSAREGARFGALGGAVSAGGMEQYADCTGIRTAAKKTAVLITILDSDIIIKYDSGHNTPLVASACPPYNANGNSLIQGGDRIVVHVVAQYTPIIRFLGFNGFQINAESS